VSEEYKEVKCAAPWWGMSRFVVEYFYHFWANDEVKCAAPWWGIFIFFVYGTLYLLGEIATPGQSHLINSIHKKYVIGVALGKLA